MARITVPTRPPRFEDFGKKTAVHTIYTTTSGVRVPGATTISGLLDKSSVLVNWATRLALAGTDPRSHKDEAAWIGKLSHYIVECWFAGVEPELDDYSANQIKRARHAERAFHNWRGNRTMIPEIVEDKLVSDEYRYGGTIDFYGLVDRLPLLVDFKTSNGIYFEHQVQVAGYWHLLVEHGYECKGVRVLRIPRTPHEGFVDHSITGSQILKLWRIFQDLLDVYWVKKSLKSEEGD